MKGAIRVNPQGRLREIQLRKSSDFLNGFACLIHARASPTRLARGEDISVLECAIWSKRHGQQWSDTVVAADADLVRSAEVTKRIGNKAIFVQLHSAGDVWTMPDDEVCSIVNHGMSDFDDIPTILPKVLFRSRLDSAELGAFTSGVHRKDHDVGLFGEPANDFEDAFEVVEVCGSLVWSEGADADFEAIFLDDGVWLCCKPRVFNAKGIEDFCGVALPGRTKVTTMVIGEG